MSGEREEVSYRSAGVNIDAAEGALPTIARLAQRTHGPAVLTGIGHFGGFFRMPADEPLVLVSTADSVGTKVLLASILGRHRGIGIDLVNHCTNDLLATGARPLFFLDYYATPALAPNDLLALVDGITEACLEAGCALIGGETAELPGIYREGAYDLAGFMVGGVQEDRIVDGSRIEAGDVVFGLPSAGLHTNGFTLARAALALNGNPAAVRARLEESPSWASASWGDLLLTPHRSYLPVVSPALDAGVVRGMAHITGGGLAGNVSRVIPEGLQAVIDVRRWTVPRLFAAIQHEGRVAAPEMYRVFNMGIGFVLVAASADAARVVQLMPEAVEIGHIERSAGDERARLTGLEGGRDSV